MMMKVKPFSYHIPPSRKAYENTANIAFSPAKKCISTANGSPSCNFASKRRKKGCQSTNSTPVPHPILSTSFDLFTLGGAGTVLVFVLLGFIGVAGQGKLHDMHSSGNSGDVFITPAFVSGKKYLSHKNIHSLSQFGVLDENESSGEEDDNDLQQSISLMGHYGAKFGNSSFSRNRSYSSHPSFHLQNYVSAQYKLQPSLGILQNTPSKNLFLSLPKNNRYVHSLASKNQSEDNRENVINLQSLTKLKRTQDEYYKGNQGSAFYEGDDFDRRNPFPMITEPLTSNNRTSNTNNNHNGFSVGIGRVQVKHNLEPYENKEAIRSSNDYNDGYLTKATSQLSPEDKSFVPTDLDDYDDEDVLERFMPGNVSHTSGKLRFRQSSQAEVDGIENENTSRSRRRPRRSVVHLYDMVVCSTGCNPLIFKGYGCYCGFLGSGLTVDGIDKCCAKHDWCYHHAKCPPLLTYFVPYYWRCDHGRPQCVTDFRGWKGICGAHLCECDRQFAECLKKFPCPRSRAMCVTSPFSNTPADARAFPFTISRRARPSWRPPPFPPPLPPPPGIPIPLIPYPQFGRLFPRYN